MDARRLNDIQSSASQQHCCLNAISYELLNKPGFQKLQFSLCNIQTKVMINDKVLASFDQNPII